MMADKNGEIKEKYTRDTLFQKLLFVAFGLDYNIIFEDYDHHTHPTLKKVRAFSCLFVVKKSTSLGIGSCQAFRKKGCSSQRSRVSKKGAGLKRCVTVPVAIVNDTQTHYENQ